MNNPIQKQFDFTNFAARVAELNRLHKLVHELSGRRKLFFKGSIRNIRISHVDPEYSGLNANGNDK